MIQLFRSLHQKKLVRLNNNQEKEHQLCSGLVQAFFPVILVPVMFAKYFSFIEFSMVKEIAAPV
jgi:hypothetical protein